MSEAALVLVCALNLLGRSAERFPPIVLVDRRPDGVSANAEGFVRRNPDVIYLLTDTPVFRAARQSDLANGRCAGRESLSKIASVIVHEEAHVRYGPDERRAYEAQLTALALLGFAPHTSVYHSVKRSMLSVLARRSESTPRQVW